MNDTPSPSPEEIRQSTVKLAEDLNAFCASHTFQNALQVKVDTVQDQTDLQLSICRKLRELLPTTNCGALLQTAQQQHWIPVLLQWLNIHDRPAVQVEALLAVTNIAEVCALHQNPTMAGAAGGAAPAWPPTLPSTAAALGGAGGTTFQEAMEAANKYTNAVSAAAAAAAAANQYAAAAAAAAASAPNSQYPFSAAAAVGGAPGSVPFPPLSFSQTLSPEAVAAFEQTIQNSSTTKDGSSNNNNNNFMSSSSGALAPAPSASMFPPTTGGINFTSLAPPPGGAHSSVPTNAFMPPPTPVANSAGSLSFPQQLSASSQHLLLRHADAIPTLISLLSSPSREV